MKVIRIRTPEAWRAAWEELRPLAGKVKMRLYRVRLYHAPDQAHYLYLLIVGKPLTAFYKVLIFDEPTDFSGTGGRYWQEMERWLREEYVPAMLSQGRGKMELHLLEMPYELYNILSIIHWHEYAEYREVVR